MAWLTVCAALAGRVAGAVLGVWWWLADWWTARCGRRRVLAAVEWETRRHVGRLVPDQRVPTDPQPWRDLIPTQRGDDQ